MQGDDKAKATVDAMMSGLLKDVSKYSLEKGVATSVLSNRKDLIRQVRKMVYACGGAFVCVRVFGVPVLCLCACALHGTQHMLHSVHSTSSVSCVDNDFGRAIPVDHWRMPVSA